MKTAIIAGVALLSLAGCSALAMAATGPVLDAASSASTNVIAAAAPIAGLGGVTAGSSDSTDLAGVISGAGLSPEALLGDLYTPEVAATMKDMGYGDLLGVLKGDPNSELLKKAQAGEDGGADPSGTDVAQLCSQLTDGKSAVDNLGKDAQAQIDAAGPEFGFLTGDLNFYLGLLGPVFNDLSTVCG